MKIRLDTLRFLGAGYLDCRKCHRRTTFPDGASLLIFDYGDRQIVRSANSAAILHECGQDFFWQCDDCGAEPSITILARHLRGRRRHVLRCHCGGEYTQHRLEIVDDQPGEIDYAVTPF